MKKCYITVLLLLLITHLQALEFFNAISVGEIGMSSNFSSSAIYGHLFNFTMQDENGLGMQIVPVRALLQTYTGGALVFEPVFEGNLNTISRLTLSAGHCILSNVISEISSFG